MLDYLLYEIFFISTGRAAYRIEIMRRRSKQLTPSLFAPLREYPKR